MNTRKYDKHTLSLVCVERCKGVCCDPWWGVIRYGITKPAQSSYSQFKKTLATSIKERVERIKTRYVTTENPPRKLFNNPERYNVIVEKIRPSSAGLTIDLCAMFAFRCLFLSKNDNTCEIHPTVLSGSKFKGDIRPPHCDELGVAQAGPGEKGHCRIIGAAIETDSDPDPENDKIDRAIEFEKNISEKHYKEGSETISLAADKVISQIKEKIRQATPERKPATATKKPGRNDPCHCGSGKKFKKCHGR